MHTSTANLPTECFLERSAKLKSPTFWSSRLVEEEVVECLLNWMLREHKANAEEYTKLQEEKPEKKKQGINRHEP